MNDVLETIGGIVFLLFIILLCLLPYIRDNYCGTKEDIQMHHDTNMHFIRAREEIAEQRRNDIESGKIIQIIHAPHIGY